MSDIILYQFPASHYNEKVRWALDLKQVPHRRISLLPGPHAPKMKRLTGRTHTPVLVIGDEVVAGSSAILAYLEQNYPDPPLEPVDQGERERALAIATTFDKQVGPAVRLAKFFEVMNGEFAIRTFCAEKSPLVRTLYRAGFPLVHQVMQRSMAINAENAMKGREETERALDYVVRESGPGGYLVGNNFSVADLTCAALLMPAVAVADLGGPALANTDAERAWLQRWADHPGAAWVREIYRRHRHPEKPL